MISVQQKLNIIPASLIKSFNISSQIMTLIYRQKLLMLIILRLDSNNFAMKNIYPESIFIILSATK